MVKIPEPGGPGPPERVAVPVAILMRVRARARPAGAPAEPSLTLTGAVQSPATLAAQLMVTRARADPPLDRVAEPEMTETAPVDGSTRKTVSPLRAAVIMPRSTFVVT